MDQLDHLRSMWGPAIKRSTKLIVPKVTYEESSGSLNNDDWVFNVPYAFRDALDIKYEQRKKRKEANMVWTQGPILRFKEGDTLTSKDKALMVQVKFANPMGWDESKHEMNQGVVLYELYEIARNQIKKISRENCSQMHFLAELIGGLYKGKL